MEGDDPYKLFITIKAKIPIITEEYISELLAEFFNLDRSNFASPEAFLTCTRKWPPTSPLEHLKHGTPLFDKHVKNSETKIDYDKLLEDVLRKEA